jgi:arabinofuranosyltransferase
MAMRKLSPIAVLAAVGAMAALRAWMCDDAFITFRVAEQYLAGEGPVLNIGERVQVFTHPLWMMALVAFAGLGAPLVPGAMWLSLAIFGAGLAALGAAFRDKPLALCVAGALMLCSRTITDFATSGLETPLTFALFAGALLALRRGTPRMALVLLALLPLNRLDLLPWALPFAWVAAGPAIRARVAASVAIAIPAAAWAVFSALYYGAALPNTALAKLGGDWTARLDQGLSFIVGSLVMDPGSLALVIAGVVIAVIALRDRERTRDREIAVAGALCATFALAYVLWSGGDFMLGDSCFPRCGPSSP